MSARTDSDESNTTKARPPRTRTRLTRLTTEQVLATALEIVDREGVDALSMRRLAQALDRDAMSVYRYAENKAALLDGVVELVLRELVIDPDAQDWTQELRLLAHRYRDLALAHPNVVPLLVTRPPLATPLAYGPWARCARSRTSSNCSSGPASPHRMRCAPTGCSSGSCKAHSR